MRKVLTFVLAVMLVMAMAVPAFAVSSPVAPVTSETKTAALPGVAILTEQFSLIAIEKADELSAAAKETFIAAQNALKAAAPEGMTVKYFFYVAITNSDDGKVTVSLKVGDVESVVVKQFKDGEWVELKSVLNNNGTVTVAGVVEGPIAIFTK